jgi:alkanesulfonate monooxygenase SsuD/methylene tetrahydromethanopterin reductase-like flavin-dependent oxidoreductase (luciferase family)
VYLGALGPKAIEQVGKIADGWLPFLFTPDTAPELLAVIEAGGRRDEIDVSPVVLLCVDDDIDKARDMARPWLTIYLGGMGAKGKNFYVEAAERWGQGDAARKVQELFYAGDRMGAAAAITPEIIDACAICCRASEIDERLAAFERAGADSLLAMPMGDRPAIIRALASAARGAAA